MSPHPVMQHIDLPGATSEAHFNLHTHSSKFPIERELILSNDGKNATKVSLPASLGNFIPVISGGMSERLASKHKQAWNHINQSQMEHMNPHQLPPGRPTKMPEDVTALAERENYGNNAKEKNPVSKTYHTIKDIISSRFKKEPLSSGSLDELNNAVVFHHKPDLESNSPISGSRFHLHSTPQSSIPRPKTEPPVYNHLKQTHNQYLNLEAQYQRAASQPQLYDNGLPGSNYYLSSITDRRGSVDNIEVTDSDDGGFISKAKQRADDYLSNGSPQTTIKKVDEKSLNEGFNSRKPPVNSGPRRAVDTPVNHPESPKVDGTGNNSNFDSGRESLVTSMGTKPQKQIIVDNDGTHEEDNTEWIDIVEASGKPGIFENGSLSSTNSPMPIFKPLPKPPKHVKEATPVYGTDSYNRAINSKPIGPTKGNPSSTITKQSITHNGVGRKNLEQSMLKKHLFGLDVDLTSTTTRSFDLESLLGMGNSISDSETDTNGLINIKYQLEGLENMYSEVLKMLKNRKPQHTDLSNPTPVRRRYGSISSLPSSSVSGRPIRDKRRIDDRRKIRDLKGINKRFQRLESHVVTLARSVAHLSSEMRSQHLVTQEIESLKADVAALRVQSGRPVSFSANQLDRSQPEPLNLTNPKRVKKLKKFFGDDPPLLRFFLQKLGYEKYANLFEKEKIGMIELPYLSEDRLQKIGVPLGPRLRILQEAQISLCKDTTLCIL